MYRIMWKKYQEYLKRYENSTKDKERKIIINVLRMTAMRIEESVLGKTLDGMKKEYDKSNKRKRR